MNGNSSQSSCDKKPCPHNYNLVVAIGASAGGFSEIMTIVENLPTWFQGTVIIATHRAPGHKNVLAEIIARHARIRVDEPEDEDCLECTTIYLGQANETVEVKGSEFDVEVDCSRHARMHRIDDLFFSVAKSSGPDAIGVVLSGMLDDGSAGLKAIKEAGGRCVIQAPDDADYPSMPIAASKQVDPDFVGCSREIASYIMEAAIDSANQ